jgi:hypothetical protein
MSKAAGLALYQVIAETMYRVRRIRDGKYLTENLCASFGDTVSLRWFQPAARRPGEWLEEQARKIAEAMIALTGDHGIEIEPVGA